MTSAETASSKTGVSAYLGRLSVIMRQPAFRWFWLGSSTQAIAQGTQFLVIGWLVLEITSSSAQLGLVIFIYGVPNVAFLLAAGVLADRFDRRYVLIATQGGVCVIITALAFLTVSDIVVIWHVYAAAGLLGAVQSLNMPARMTLVSDLVDEGSLLDAVAMQNAAVHAGRIVGPAAAGVVIEVWGLSASLFAISVCYAVSMAFVAKIGRTSQPAPSTGQSVFRNFTDGLSYIKNNPMVLTVIVITCSFGGFGMSHFQIIPAMAKEVLDAGAAEVGLLLLASGVGSLIGSVMVPIMGVVRVYRSLIISLVLFAVFLTLFAWSSWFWVSWALFLVLGVVSLGSVWPLASTIIQLESPSEVRGRVMGVLQFTPGFHYLGAFPLALAAGQWGWGVAMTGAAVITLIISIWFGLLRKGAPDLSGWVSGQDKGE
jgi:MFS family permease